MQGYRNYKEVEIETASGLKLVVLLYSGALKFLNIARTAIEKKDYENSNRYLIKTQDIISELMSSLNFEAGEIAHNLNSLYIYINRRLLEANIYKNIELIDEASKLLTTLKSAWDELLKEQSAGGTVNTNAGLNISG